MLQKILETIIGLVILAFLLYGLFLGGKWVIGLFTNFKPVTLVFISLAIFFIPLLLGFITLGSGSQAAGPMSIAIMMILFSLIGLIISFIWYLIQ